MIWMGKWSIESLEKTADYQDFIQNRRPAQQARDAALRAKFAAKREVNEVKTLHHAITKDSERRQQVLTPAQQLETRKNIAASASVEDALAVVDLYIFGDATNGEADGIDVMPETFTHRHLYMYSPVSTVAFSKPPDTIITHWFYGEIWLEEGSETICDCCLCFEFECVCL